MRFVPSALLRRIHEGTHRLKIAECDQTTRNRYRLYAVATQRPIRDKMGRPACHVRFNLGWHHVPIGPESRLKECICNYTPKFMF